MKIWVVEQNMGRGRWEPLKHAKETVACFSCRDAHAQKNEIVDMWWDIPKSHVSRHFRVRAYVPFTNDCTKTVPKHTGKRG